MENEIHSTSGGSCVVHFVVMTTAPRKGKEEGLSEGKERGGWSNCLNTLAGRDGN